MKLLKVMLIEIEDTLSSLGTEPIQLLGFKTDEELEAALLPLMEELKPEEFIAA